MAKHFKLLKYLINIKGRFLKNNFDQLTKNPYEAQKKALKRILKCNASTEYGGKHHFAKIIDEKDYKRTVPINKYSDLEPFIVKMIKGHKNILTSKTPFMFNVTSGTTDKPKYIPITPEVKKLTANFSHQWLYRSLLDHPAFLDSSSLYISGSAIGGFTESGIPHGCATGMIYKSLPPVLRGGYVLPYIVSDIDNYELKYYLIARLSLEKDISFIATPNPLTLIRIAETGINYQEKIIKSIHDGTLYDVFDNEINNNDLKIIDIIKKLVKPNHSRANYLNNIIATNGKLLPGYCWENLSLIGCWLGGSIGFQADKLPAYYGNKTAMRDLGYVASEGCITLPYQDFSPSGILALNNNYYEFIPENQADHGSPDILLCNELEVGKCYKILLTNQSGLYRYDINDVVQVTGYYNRTPTFAFIRKSDDMQNIAGEKLHVNHLIMAFNNTCSKMDIVVSQFRVVPDYEKIRYDVLLSFKLKPDDAVIKNSFMPEFDKILSEINLEYKNKRNSKRLNPPCFHIMDSGWEESIYKQYIESGHRDAQYKWKMIAPKLSEIDKKHIKYSLEL